MTAEKHAYVPPLITLAMMLVLAATTSAVAGPPPVECHAGTTNSIVIRDRGPDVLVTVGRPTLQLHQYLLGRGYALPDRDECFLVLDAQGKPVQDMGYVMVASDVYHFSDKLLNEYFSPYGDTELDPLITEIQDEIIKADTWLGAAIWTEALEFVRNTVVKIIIAIKTGEVKGAFAEVTQAAIEAFPGYVADTIIDASLFNKKSQRRIAARGAELYVRGQRKRLDIANAVKNRQPLLCDADDNSPQDLYAHLAAIHDGSSPGYTRWKGHIFNATEASLEGIAGNVLNQGLDTADSVAASYIGKVIGPNNEITKTLSAAIYKNATPLTVGIPFTKIRYRGLEQVRMAQLYHPKTFKGFYTTDALFMTLHMALEEGVIDAPVFANTPFADFVHEIAVSRQPGQYLHRIYTISQRSHAFQDAILAEFYSPGAVSGLTVTYATPSSARLSWITPSDDMGTAGVADHEIRYSDRAIVSEEDWYKAVAIHKPTGPMSAGLPATVDTGDLPAGRYWFAVRGKDAHGNLSPMPNSSDIVLGVDSNPIGLSNKSPNLGSAFQQKHSYFAWYSHQAGVAPSQRHIYLNGAPHQMTRLPGGNMKDGVLYSYDDSTPYASGSTVQYHFEYRVGPHSKRSPETGAFSLAVDPVLYDSDIQPAYSSGFETRTFRITYRHPEGKWPISSQLRFPGSTPISMRMLRGTPTDGAVYEARAYVSTSTTNYWFDFSDGSQAFRSPVAGYHSVDVASVADVAVIDCAMPQSVTCGQVVPVRPKLRNIGTMLASNCRVYFNINGVEARQVVVNNLAPGITRSSAAAYDWIVPIADTARTYSISVGITPVPGETAIDDNVKTFVYEVPPGRGSIKGYVYDETGVNPVTGATVHAFAATADASSAVSDNTGLFQVSGLIPAAYNLRVEKDGQKYQVTGVSVHALATNNVGQCRLSGASLSKHTSFTGSNFDIVNPTVSPYDGMVAFNADDDLYMMKPDGSGLHKFFPDSSGPYFDQPDMASFSPARREFVFCGRRAVSGPDPEGIFRVEYDNNGNYLNATLIVDDTNIVGRFYNPQYLPDGETILFFRRSSTNIPMFYAVSRTGQGLTNVFAPVLDHDLDVDYSLSPDGTLLVSPDYVYSLDLITGVLTPVRALTNIASSLSVPRFTPDGRRVIYTGGRVTEDLYSFEWDSDNPPIQLTFDSDHDKHGCASRDGKRLYYVRNTAQDGTVEQLWSRTLEWPSVYSHNHTFSQGGSSSGYLTYPVTLDGDGTNDTCTFSFMLSGPARASVKVTDCQSQLVKSLCDGVLMPAGSNSVTWRAVDEYDLAVPFGVYFLTLSVVPDGVTNPTPFTYRSHIPVVYETTVLTNGNSRSWTVFEPDGKGILFTDSNSELHRFRLDWTNPVPLGISGVQAFDVNRDFILTTRETTTSGYDRVGFSWYTTSGVFISTWVQGVDSGQMFNEYGTFASVHPNGQEFVFADEVVETIGGAQVAHWNVFKSTGPGVRIPLAATAQHEFGPYYSQGGSNVLFSSGATDEDADIFEVSASGGASTRLTTHPFYEALPRSIPDCSRIIFRANWAAVGSELWASDRGGGNPWWLHNRNASSFSISRNADTLAWAGSKGLTIASLPEALNAGSIRGRVVDLAWSVGLADVPVRALRGGTIITSTRSNSRGYFKLLSIPGGVCDVVVGGAGYFEAITPAVTVIVARTTEIGSKSVIPSPSATLVDPVAGTTIGQAVPIAAIPSETCSEARYEWRRTTNDIWTVGATLTASNSFAAIFSASAAGWSNGTYYLRAVGRNTNALVDPSPIEIDVTFDRSGPPLSVSLDTAGASSNLYTIATTKEAGASDLGTLVFEVKYPGTTNWTELGAVNSTNAADKKFNQKMIPLGATALCRVKSYDSVGNEYTSASLDFTRTNPGDADSDGIPDSWETTRGLNPGNPADGELDNDGDGLSNLAEYLAGSSISVMDTDGDGLTDWQEIYVGTSPTNRADYLRTFVVPSDAGNYVVRWSSAYGRQYTVARTTNLLSNFLPVATNLFATPPENFYTTTPVNATSPHFYQIQAE